VHKWPETLHFWNSKIGGSHSAILGTEDENEFLLPGLKLFLKGEITVQTSRLSKHLERKLVPLVFVACICSGCIRVIVEYTHGASAKSGRRICYGTIWVHVNRVVTDVEITREATQARGVGVDSQVASRTVGKAAARGALWQVAAGGASMIHHARI